DQLFSLSSQESGGANAPENYRKQLIDINGLVSQKQLHMSWTYSQHLHQSDTIFALAQNFMRQLRALIAYCLEPGHTGHTPSDFPLAKLTQAHIDHIAGEEQAIEDIYPLSSMQEGLLFHTLYAPGEGDYITQVGCTFTGNFSPAIFQQAWQRTI